MLVSARNESSQLSMRMPMAIDEFLRIVSIQPPPKGAPLQLEFQWVKSEDHKLQVKCACVWLCWQEQVTVVWLI
jgi:hypothetical protein